MGLLILVNNAVGTKNKAKTSVVSPVRAQTSLEGHIIEEILFLGNVVQNPGPFPYVKGRGVLEHIYDAGVGRIRDVITVKRLQEKGKYQAYKLSLSAFLEQDLEDFPITPGSIIYIPQRLIELEDPYPDEYYAENQRKLAEYVRKLRDRRAKEQESRLLETE